jgi:flagellar hook-basal body complex protein FliE
MIEAVSAMQGILSELGSLASTAAPDPSDAGPSLAPSSGASGASSFSGLFNAALGRLDGAVAGADAKAQAFAAGGDDIPLSDVMISLEQANLALQMAGNVRDKVTAAYSSVMNMQL